MSDKWVEDECSRHNGPSDEERPPPPAVDPEASKRKRMAMAVALAAEAGNAQEIQRLVNAGASTTHVSGDGRTPLHLAVLHGHEKCLDVLLAHGAHVDINRKDQKGRTPLHLATLTDHLSCVRALLTANAYPLVTDHDGKTPLDIATDRQQPAILKCIKDAPVEIAFIEVAVDEPGLIFQQPQTTEIPYVVAGTIDKLVNRLVYLTHPDLEFVSAFLTTFRSFMTPQRLLDMLLERFLRTGVENQNHYRRDELEKMRKLRVMSVLIKWVGVRENHDPELFETPSIVKQITVFADSLLEKGELTGSAEKLKRQLALQKKERAEREAKAHNTKQMALSNGQATGHLSPACLRPLSTQTSPVSHPRNADDHQKFPKGRQGRRLSSVALSTTLVDDMTAAEASRNDSGATAPRPSTVISLSSRSLATMPVKRCFSPPMATSTNTSPKSVSSVTQYERVGRGRGGSGGRETNSSWLRNEQRSLGGLRNDVDPMFSSSISLFAAPSLDRVGFGNAFVNLHVYVLLLPQGEALELDLPGNATVGSLLSEVCAKKRLSPWDYVVTLAGAGTPLEVDFPLHPFVRVCMCEVVGCSDVVFDYIDPGVLANELTALDSRCYNRIKPIECQNQNWTKRQIIAPNITELVNRFNSVVAWTVDRIISGSTPTSRAANIVKFISLGHRFLQLNNFHGVFQMVAALKISAVSRLRASWSLVDDASLAHFSEIKDIASPQDNFGAYRTRLHACNPPCVPYIGVHMSDLVFIEDANTKYYRANYSNLFEGSEEGPLIHFQKYQRMALVLEEIRRYQNLYFPFKPTSRGYENLFARVPPLDEDATYALSLRKEPRQPTIVSRTSSADGSAILGAVSTGSGSGGGGLWKRSSKSNVSSPNAVGGESSSRRSSLSAKSKVTMTLAFVKDIASSLPGFQRNSSSSTGSSGSSSRRGNNPFRRNRFGGSGSGSSSPVATNVSSSSPSPLSDGTPLRSTSTSSSQTSGVVDSTPQSPSSGPPRSSSSPSCLAGSLANSHSDPPSSYSFTSSSVSPRFSSTRNSFGARSLDESYLHTLTPHLTSPPRLRSATATTRVSTAAIDAHRRTPSSPTAVRVRIASPPISILGTTTTTMTRASASAVQFPSTSPLATTSFTEKQHPTNTTTTKPSSPPLQRTSPLAAPSTTTTASLSSSPIRSSTIRLQDSSPNSSRLLESLI